MDAYFSSPNRKFKLFGGRSKFNPQFLSKNAQMNRDCLGLENFLRKFMLFVVAFYKHVVADQSERVVSKFLHLCQNGFLHSTIE